MARFSSESLTERHDVDDFDSGIEALDGWLIRSAMHAQMMRTARSFVWHREDNVVVAYFALAAHLVYRRDLPSKVGRGSPNEIPSILLARFALDRTLQGKGLGAELLWDAMERVVTATNSIGARVLVVDAIDERASSFYQRFGFTPVRDQPSRLYQKINDIAAALQR